MSLRKGAYAAASCRAAVLGRLLRFSAPRLVLLVADLVPRALLARSVWSAVHPLRFRWGVAWPAAARGRAAGGAPVAALRPRLPRRPLGVLQLLGGHLRGEDRDPGARRVGGREALHNQHILGIAQCRRDFRPLFGGDVDRV